MPLFNKSINETTKVPLVSILALRASRIAGIEATGMEIMSAGAGKLKVIWASYSKLSFIILADQVQPEEPIRKCTELIYHYIGLVLGEKLFGSDEQLKKFLRDNHVNIGLNFLLSGMGQTGECTWFADLLNCLDYTFPKHNQRDIQSVLKEVLEQCGGDAICILIERKILAASSRWENLPILDAMSLTAIAQATLNSSSIFVNITQHGARQLRLIVLEPQTRVLILFPEDSRFNLTSEQENNFVKKIRKLLIGGKESEFFTCENLQGFLCVDLMAKKSYWSINSLSGEPIINFNIFRTLIKNKLYAEEGESYGCYLDLKFFHELYNRWRFLLLFRDSVSLSEMRSTLRLIKRRVSELE